MTALGTLLGSVVLTIFLSGCTSSKLLVANTLALSGNYERQPDVAYGDSLRQRFDLYSPGRKVPAKRTTVIFIPGGCWGACETFPKEDYRFVADALTAEGYRVAILNYRLFPEVHFAEIMSDVSTAVDRLTTGSLGGIPEPTSLVLMGHSAGAHLSALLAMDERYLSASVRNRLRGWIGLAGPYNFLPFKESYQPVLFGPEPRFADSQPINFVSRNDPPALLLHGLVDNVVSPRNLVSLSRQLSTAGVAVQTRCYGGIDHGLIVGALARPIRVQYPVLTDVLAFLASLNSGQVSESSTSADRANICPLEWPEPLAALEAGLVREHTKIQ